MRKNLKMLRHELELTQEEMAHRLGVTRTTYCNIENGKSEGSAEFWFSVAREFPEENIAEIAKKKEKPE